MIYNLLKDPNLKGYTFENTVRVLLRRKNKNNFIFQTNRFDDILEVGKKYRIKKIPDNIIKLMENNWKKADLIEFKLNNKEERLFEKIILYDVKTKNNYVHKSFEFCKSDFDFFSNNCNVNNVEVYVISIVLFEEWRFSINIYDFNSVKKMVYTRYKCSIN